MLRMSKNGAKLVLVVQPCPQCTGHDFSLTTVFGMT